ncbi:MAG: hypothetical protein WAK95_08165 [Desulfobacterales bacterium]
MIAGEENKGLLSSKAVLVIIALSCGLFLSWLTAARAQVTCPLTKRPYTAVIEDEQPVARVGEPFFILVRLDPETPPPSYYVSTLVDVLQGPDGARPEVVTGFPKIRLTMDRPGTYTLLIRVTLVTKPSCGGVEAEEILRKQVALQVS